MKKACLTCNIFLELIIFSINRLSSVYHISPTIINNIPTTCSTCQNFYNLLGPFLCFTTNQFARNFFFFIVYSAPSCASQPISLHTSPLPVLHNQSVCILRPFLCFTTNQFAYSAPSCASKPISLHRIFFL